MPSKRDFKINSADTHLRERVQKQVSRTAFAGFIKEIRSICMVNPANALFS